MKVTSERQPAYTPLKNEQSSGVPLKISPTTADPSERPGAIHRWAFTGASLFQTRAQRIWAIIGFLAIILVPLSTADAFLLSLGITIGIYTIATIGLNVMIGYTGMISLSHSIFVGIGAFTAVALGGILELPLLVWLPGSFIFGGLIAAIIAPLNLRIRGVFQIILSLGLIFIGLYAFVNIPSVTGGNAGITASPSLSLGVIDFAQISLFGMHYAYDQGLFILVWFVVAASMIAVTNMMRTRFGRSMVASRENETAAQLAGINVSTVKIRAFIIAGAFGGLAGGLLLAQLRYVTAEQFGIEMGLELLIITVVGGLGISWGPLFGSLIVASIPLLAQQYGAALPFFKADPGAPGFGIPVAQVGLLFYGAALVLVMALEPRGLAQIAHSIGKKLLGLFHREKSPQSPNKDASNDLELSSR